jgi:molecular chaperone DnaJ
MSWSGFHVGGFEVNGVVNLSFSDVLEGSIKDVSIVIAEPKILENKTVVTETKIGTVSMKIPPGIRSGSIIQTEVELEGKKYAVNVQAVLNIPVGFTLLPNGDAVRVLPISYPTSILGGVVEVETLTGKKEKLRIPERIRPGMAISVKEQGLPRSPRDLTRGSLLYSIVVEIPEEVDEETKVILRQLQEKLEQQTIKTTS